MKGHVIGGARVSPTHANFIVNDGTATARDIRALVELCRTTVRERFERLWGKAPPVEPGKTIPEMYDAATAGSLPTSGATARPRKT